MAARDRVVRERRTPLQVRGGISLIAILTGVVVSFGAVLILSSIVAGFLTATGIEADEFTIEDATDIGVGILVALLVVQFVAYVWGGYTAGRMGRGAGIANGLLVPLLALVVLVVVGAIVAGTDPDIETGFAERVNNLATRYGEGNNALIAIVSLATMFVGGAVGGLAGARWHTRLERDAEAEEADAAPVRRDARDDRVTDADGRPGDGDRTVVRGRDEATGETPPRRP